MFLTRAGISPCSGGDIAVFERGYLRVRTGISLPAGNECNWIYSFNFCDMLMLCALIFLCISISMSQSHYRPVRMFHQGID